MTIPAVLVLWLAWVAWSALERTDVGDLLVLAGILVAFPAWHAIARALDRERAASVSAPWLKRLP